MRRLKSSIHGPLVPDSIEHIFREIISACRGIQANVRVAFLGPEATFSHLAAMRRFGECAEFIPADSIEEVFRKVEGNGAEFGVVPVENSTHGTIGETFDAFLHSPLQICGEMCLRISNSLLTKATSLDQIRRVYSHPQPIAQCRNWLTKYLPNAVCVALESTAKAGERAAAEPDAAAIGGELVKEKYGLTALATDIQDRSSNQTRFWIISKEGCNSTGKDKTSLRFSASHKPGSLFRCLGVFAENGVNITRIESRPSPSRVWEYVFFLDIEGHRNDEPVAKSLSTLSDVVGQIYVMGSYPTSEDFMAGEKR
jgi:chorismate mutase/prephenate dehydratase